VQVEARAVSQSGGDWQGGPEICSPCGGFKVSWARETVDRRTERKRADRAIKYFKGTSTGILSGSSNYEI